MDKSSKSSLMTSGTPKLAQNPNFMFYLVPSEIPTMWNIHVVLHVLKKDQALHQKNTKNSMKICQKLTVLSNCHNKTAFSNMSNGDISRTFFNMQGARCSSTKATLDGAKKQLFDHDIWFHNTSIWWCRVELHPMRHYPMRHG